MARRALRQHGRTSSPLGKRKTALALSVGLVGVSSPAASFAPLLPGIVASSQYNDDQRRMASALRASEALKETMIEEEGVRYTVYRDSAGNPTVGIGHLVTAQDDLAVGQRISQERALDLFERDLARAERVVTNLVGALPLSQHEFDALVDLAFNVGEGNLSPDASPRLNAAIRAGDYPAMADELGYHYADGEHASGLAYRSERRSRIFLEAAYENPRINAADEWRAMS